ncbi:MAG: DUF4126 family protein [Neorhizobium sp.]|jgi:uncharacterized membrane protein|nr:DUF4126 family protein [Neorhizobium sp.]
MTAVLALLMGVVCGLRAMTAPAAVAWAAYAGWLPLTGSWIAFMGSVWAVLIFTLAAAMELVTDQLPSTPSRKVPAQFAARIAMGALTGAAIGLPYGIWLAGLVSGVIGAVIGTLGGASLRGKLAARFGSDPPAAFIEDGVAIAGAIVLMLLLPAAPTI